MIITFLTPTERHPVGGVAMIFEFASELAARGHHIQLVHHSTRGRGVDSLAEVDWYDFPDTIDHIFIDLDTMSAEDFPSGDVVFAHAPSDHMPERIGLPVIFIQGFQMFRRELEEPSFHAPCPKLCVAPWLVEVGIREFGVPEEQLHHVPLGLRHDTYRLITPLAERPPRVSFCYNPHIQKGAPMAVRVLRRVRSELPELDAVAFGSGAPDMKLPHWLDYRRDPPREELVGDVYNRSRVFLGTSRLEGFGLPPIEAMACGAALACTDNGGSAEYAFHGETALVSEPGDDATMAEHVVRLLTDDSERLRLAEAGRRHVETFRWSRSAEILEKFLHAYVEDPVAFGYQPPG